MMELYPGYLEDHFNIHKLSSGTVPAGASPPEYMATASAQYAPPPLRMGMYELEPRHHQPHPPPPPQQQQQPVVGMWSSEPYKVDSGGQATSGSTIMEGDAKFDHHHAELEDVPHMDDLEEAEDADQEARQGPPKACTEQRGCPEKSSPKKGLHPAARDEPDKAGPARARASTRQAAERPVRESGRPARRVRGGAHGPRRGGVRDRVRALGGRAEAAHHRAARRAAEPGHVRAGAPDAGGDRAGQLRPPLPDQERRRLRRRLLRHVGSLALPRRALLPLDRRLPAIRSPQHPEPAAAAADGPADGGGVQSAAVVGAGGGRAVAGHGEAAADAVGGPHEHRRPLRRARRLQHGVDQRRGEAQGTRRLRAAGGPSPAGDAAEHAQDPHHAAGGEGPPRAGGLLPAPPRAQLALGDATARVGDKLDVVMDGAKLKCCRS